MGNNISVYKNTWSDPFSGKLCHECGYCRRRVSAKVKVCPYCGAIFINMPERKEKQNRLQ